MKRFVCFLCRDGSRVAIDPDEVVAVKENPRGNNPCEIGIDVKGNDRANYSYHLDGHDFASVMLSLTNRDDLEMLHPKDQAVQATVVQPRTQVKRYRYQVSTYLRSNFSAGDLASAGRPRADLGENATDDDWELVTIIDKSPADKVLVVYRREHYVPVTLSSGTSHVK